ncbi:hypothetical protein ANCCEY_15678 [Ancylostoma ceylanicum]|uniref:Guanylate cyclase domain-containing protein n=1 Tax=Ancylostoma ceylanicum TaxID=53326 RepID=A0A0D6L3L2_9BILA|nr:hypothetical protein ANCCEY_15678 [Ancylostoma ceylanicum]
MSGHGFVDATVHVTAASVHMSSDARELLNQTYPGFNTECRGEVIIKGKGVMETYWLLGRDEAQNNSA